MTRKFIALDIDGTLLNSQKEPLESTMKALRRLRKAGHLVTIATGRSRLLAKQVIHQLGCTNYIICNGAAAFMDHEQVYKHLLDREALLRLKAFADERKVDMTLFSLDSLGQVSNWSEPTVAKAMNSFTKIMPKLEENFMEKHEIYQGCAFYDASMDEEFEAAFPEFRFVRWHENSVDVLPKGGSKAATILHLAEKVGIASENVVTFGDGNNDIEMLKLAGMGVAMGNASPIVQAAANLVTDTNDQDGIWKALHKLDLIY